MDLTVCCLKYIAFLIFDRFVKFDVTRQVFLKKRGAASKPSVSLLKREPFSLPFCHIFTAFSKNLALHFRLPKIGFDRSVKNNLPFKMLSNFVNRGFDKEFDKDYNKIRTFT